MKGLEKELHHSRQYRRRMRLGGRVLSFFLFLNKQSGSLKDNICGGICAVTRMSRKEKEQRLSFPTYNNKGSSSRRNFKGDFGKGDGIGSKSE